MFRKLGLLVVYVNVAMPWDVMGGVNTCECLDERANVGVVYVLCCDDHAMISMKYSIFNIQIQSTTRTPIRGPRSDKQ